MDTAEAYTRARMTEPDWAGGITPLQDEIKRLRAFVQRMQFVQPQTLRALYRQAQTDTRGDDDTWNSYDAWRLFRDRLTVILLTNDEA